MPPRHRPEDCPHTWVLRRTIAFSGTEQEIAKARNLGLPDLATFDFCTGCWSLNPQVRIIDDQTKPTETQ